MEDRRHQPGRHETPWQSQVLFWVGLHKDRCRGSDQGQHPQVKLSGRERLVAGFSGRLGPLCLVPQGVVPAVILLADAHLRLWFLALYFPAPLRWPVAFLMVLLGICFCYEAIRLTIKSSRPHRTAG
jgi:hypothetical protein